MTILDNEIRSHQKRKWITPKKGVLGFIIIIIILSIALDAQTKSTINQKAADYTTFAATLKYEVQTCNGPRSQGYQAYQKVLSHQMKPSMAINIVTAAESQCTPIANTNIYNMDTTSVPSDLSGLHLAQTLKTMNYWTFLSAAATLVDMKELIINPNNAVAAHDLKSKEKQMKIQAQQTQLILSKAAKKTGAKNISLNIP